MAILLAMAAALANAFTSILQRLGVQKAPPGSSMRWSLIAHALKQPVWFAGFATMAAGFVLQFLALDFGGLDTVQPVLTFELVFLVIIVGLWFRQHLGWHELVGASATSAGLAGFLFASAPGGGDRIPGVENWLEMASAILVVVAALVLLAHRGNPKRRAALFGSAAALGFAFTASLIKATTTHLHEGGWSAAFGHWEIYGLALSGLISMFLAQNAFHAGPITISQSALVVVDPLASILIGISLFGDRLMTSGVRGPGEAIALLALFIGVVTLAHSPLVAAVKADGPAPVRSTKLAGHRTLFQRGAS
ncbi:MAG: DMT family transporter [Actinobacteria bacterium]|nr:DMT family transporter [Actinomycetota bacterium]